MTQLFEIQLRNDTAANWVAANPTLLAGEFGFEVDTGKFKIGTGSSAYNSLPYGSTGALVVNGSRGTPNNIAAVSGISVLGVPRELQFIQGSGGPVTITAAAPIAAGTLVGQELILMGCSSTNTVTFDSGTGVVLNGPIVMGSAFVGGTAGSVITLIWDGMSWNEVSRR